MVEGKVSSSMSILHCHDDDDDASRLAHMADD